MTDADMARLAIGGGIRYGLGRVQKEMAAAGPPAPGTPDLARVNADFSQPAGFGSNAVALGSALTQSGRGLLFGNPHYPWHGSSRFHLIHLTLPGELADTGEYEFRMTIYDCLGQTIETAIYYITPLDHYPVP